MADELNAQGEPQERSRFLRRSDQRFLAAMLLLAGLGLFGSWWQTGSDSGPLTDWGASSTHTACFEVNINSAPWPEMTQLPEIGETLARRIVENRGTEGPFHCPEDLIRVHGIGEKKLAQIRPYLSPESWPPQPTKDLPAP